MIDEYLQAPHVAHSNYMTDTKLSASYLGEGSPAGPLLQVEQPWPQASYALPVMQPLQPGGTSKPIVKKKRSQSLKDKVASASLLN